MHQCVLYGRLPGANLAYIEQVLSDPLNLPKPREVAERVQFTNGQRERNRLWTIPPTDMTKAQLAKQRREKDKQRKMMARRKARAQTREIYLVSFAGSLNQTKPWLALNMSKATWYRKGKPVTLGSSAPLNTVRLGSSAPI